MNALRNMPSRLKQSIVRRREAVKQSIGRWQRQTKQSIANGRRRTKRRIVESGRRTGQSVVAVWHSIVIRCGTALQKFFDRCRRTSAVIGRRFRQAVPYIKAFIVVSLFAGPWAFAIHGFETLMILPFGLMIAFYYTRLYRWDAGAVFGVLAVYFLGPVMALVLPFVTGTATFMVLSAISGVLWGLSFGLGMALVDQAGLAKADPFSAESEPSKSLIGLMFGFVPMAALMLLGNAAGVRGTENYFGGAFFFYGTDCLSTMVLAYNEPNLRPVLKFYQELKPLLRAMRNGLASFAIGYGFTIFIFAGTYMALYQMDPATFQPPTDRKLPLGAWDFIYFSVTTMTTVGLSEVKPSNVMFWPQALVSVELVVGVFWIVVYFAVAMTLLQVHAKRVLNPSRKSARHWRRRHKTRAQRVH